MSNYTSSIIFKYGDVDKVKQDAKTLRDIIARQGSSLLIDCIAEHVGEAAINHNFDQTEKMRIVRSLTEELREAILERI